MIPSRTVGRQQLFFVLQERIQRGQYAPGSWLPAERALAQEFGMDRSAIRHALQMLEDRGLIVREAGKRPWVRGSQEQHEVVSSSNGGGHSQEVRLRTIAAILPQHPLYPASLAILHGLSATLRTTEAPYRIQVIDTHDSSELRETSLEKRALESVIQEKIAGVVLWQMGGAETLPQLRELERRGIPVVFIDRYPVDMPCDFVGGDNQASVETAISYLRQLGHRRIAHLTTDEQSTAVLERLVAFQELMRTAGVSSVSDLTYAIPHDDTTAVAPAYDLFFSLPEPPTAVFTMNDSLAYHFMAECRKRGKDVPGDISVIGCDDLEQHSPRPALLTTLHQPFDKMGRRAAGLLLRRLAEPVTQPESKRHILLPTTLVKRLTCRSL